MSLAAADAEDRAAQLLALTRRLEGRLREDAEAFERRRPQAVAATAPETLRLANLYRHETQRIAADPGLLEGASLAARRRLAEATASFQAQLSRYGLAVEAARVVTEGLVGAVAREVAQRRSRGAGYGPSARARTADASAITLNQRA